MKTIFINSENSKTANLHELLLKLTINGIDFPRGESATHEENIKTSYKRNKFKISAPTWNDKFELPDGSYY